MNVFSTSTLVAVSSQGNSPGPYSILRVGLRLSWSYGEETNILPLPGMKANFSMVNLLARPPLWSSGESSWLQTQRSGVDSRRYQIFWEVVGLERGPLCLVSGSEELLEKVAGPV
jgi:hypothetical protein